MAELAAAISALYRGHGEAQSQANAWLNSFQLQPGAWDACVELVQPGSEPEVAFFCANMLLTKARKEWHTLPSDQQSRLASTIRQVCAKSARTLRACLGYCNAAAQPCFARFSPPPSPHLSAAII
jgi:hypothetical protein